MTLQILADNASEEDFLHFDRYINPLCNILEGEDAQTPFTIGIFGAWGAGKTTLLTQLAIRLRESKNKKYIVINFNPWLYRDETSILIPLLHTIQDELQNSSRIDKLTDSVKRISTTLLTLGADMLLKGFTAGATSVEGLEALEQRYLEHQGQVTSELRTLRETMQKIARDLADENARLVFMIDDLDRCDPSTIIDVLESVKLFLDVENTFTLIAVDKEVIDLGIEIKYGKFKFSSQRREKIGAEYFEKMVQLPLHLFPLDDRQIEQFIGNQAVPENVEALVPILKNLLEPNPRKIKRVLNILAVTLEIVGSSKSEAPIDAKILSRLVILQVQYSSLYKHIIETPALVSAMEEVFARKREASKGGFNDFDDPQRMSTIAATYHQAGTRLHQIFEDANFPTELGPYISLLSGRI